MNVYIRNSEVGLVSFGILVFDILKCLSLIYIFM